MTRAIPVSLWRWPTPRFIGPSAAAETASVPTRRPSTWAGPSCAPEHDAILRRDNGAIEVVLGGSDLIPARLYEIANRFEINSTITGKGETVVRLSQLAIGFVLLAVYTVGV